jgi:hypothetical protein
VDESGVSPVDIIPPWFSMLMYHLSDEQRERWWPQFRDVVSLHRHDHQHRCMCVYARVCVTCTQGWLNSDLIFRCLS